ncbi:DsbC family protein [Nitrosospira sp. NRS527]|uniref:DsbC family protein n=1 Tax=Nitrosospira sp. NRS527 TaxID=155925 RepID=UPI001AFC8515|nr:DsbC family protein [Nitrosospira sp. NRS527]BCT69047.1 putative thiol:disulfide interchange protein DsbC [Nitrosospira sp. NRS527]
MRINLVFSSLLLCFLFGTAFADEASLKKAIQANFPGEKIESLKKTPYLGLYEVVVGGELFYTDEKASYLFFGHVVDPQTKQSLTSDRLQQIKDARRISVDSLPLEYAIKAVKGNGKRKLVVFSDPNCPYCKRLEKELANVNDVTVYTLLYPVLNGSAPTATSIWCSPDRLKAWEDFMLKGIAPTGKDCETPIDKLLQAGQKNGISGTPTLIFADGSIAPGLMAAEAIEKKLGASSAK